MGAELLVRGDPDPIVIAPADLAAEVAQCIAMIITTPKGTVPLNRDFGLDWDLVDLPQPRAQALMAVEISRQIAKYEPRAQVISITWADDLVGAADGRLIPLIRFKLREGVAA
ncbi:MAG: GPW/gp25 family protein [Deltaproteobacteria bacterium]|nr:GPW/gp25 family protein [Deltaproteobacteria bacterium]